MVSPIFSFFSIVLLSREKHKENAWIKKKAGKGFSFTGPFLLAAGLFHFEGIAIGALHHGGMRFMSSDLNLIQRAVVLVAAMMLALLNGALDGFVGLTVVGLHFFFPSFFLGFAYSFPETDRNISAFCFFSKKQTF